MLLPFASNWHIFNFFFSYTDEDSNSIIQPFQYEKSEGESFAFSTVTSPPYVGRRMSVQEVCSTKEEKKIVLLRHYCSSKKNGLENVALILLPVNRVYGYNKLN